MERFVKGDVVIVPFPFSDLSQAKRRPALIVATLPGNDLILCQITSRLLFDYYAIAIDEEDFTEGGLRQNSYVRPNRLFTADKQVVLYKAGHLRTEKLDEVIAQIVKMAARVISYFNPTYILTPIMTVGQPPVIVFVGPSASKIVSPWRQAGKLLIQTVILPLITTPGP